MGVIENIYSFGNYDSLYGQRGIRQVLFKENLDIYPVHYRERSPAIIGLTSFQDQPKENDILIKVIWSIDAFTKFKIFTLEFFNNNYEEYNVVIHAESKAIVKQLYQRYRWLEGFLMSTDNRVTIPLQR